MEETPRGDRASVGRQVSDDRGASQHGSTELWAPRGTGTGSGSPAKRLMASRDMELAAQFHLDRWNLFSRVILVWRFCFLIRFGVGRSGPMFFGG